MKSFILVLMSIYSIGLNGQVGQTEIITSDFFNGTIPLTNRDSVMLDSINHLIRNFKILNSTILSLKDSNYSFRLQDIAYDKFVFTIDKVFENETEFILRNLRDYQFLDIPSDPTLQNISSFNDRILKSEILRNIIANKIIEDRYLYKCDLFNTGFLDNFKTRYSPENIYELNKNSFIMYLAFLLKEKINLLDQELKASTDSCFINNMIQITDYIKNDQYLKQFYKN